MTTPLRTGLDLARRLPLVEAVVALDRALHLKLVGFLELRDHVDRSSRLPGLPPARRVIELVEPDAESRIESRLRMILVLGGLPRPQVQVELREINENFLARPDLLFATARPAIEYDGATHRENLVADNRRQNRLHRAGSQLLRYTGLTLQPAPRDPGRKWADRVASRRRCKRGGSRGSSDKHCEEDYAVEEESSAERRPGGGHRRAVERGARR